MYKQAGIWWGDRVRGYSAYLGGPRGRYLVAFCKIYLLASSSTNAIKVID